MSSKKHRKKILNLHIRMKELRDGVGKTNTPIYIKKISKHHRMLLNQALTYGINLINLRKKYKLEFAVKLFKYIQSETERKNDKIALIFPKNNTETEFLPFDYIKELKDAGFKIKEWSDSFDDKENSEKVSIPRYGFEPLK
ncbi:MAG: hypothetical protein WAV23_01990 [Minisyncoccia bacterium]